MRKFHLLSSPSEMVKRDLFLSSCESADDVFRLLDSKYGNKAKIVLMINNKVQSLPSIRGNNPRRTIELIQAVERALCNLQILGEEDAMKNRVIAYSLESKLPPTKRSLSGSGGTASVQPAVPSVAVASVASVPKEGKK